MERFCDKCGTLVSGDGRFCPTCGAPMESAVNLDKPSASSGPATEPMQPTAPTAPANTYGQSERFAQMPNYPQTYNTSTSVSNSANEMTVGQWVLTLFLSGLGIIGLILLFVWAFGADTPTSKKNFSRAMLIWYAIAYGLVILFYVGMFVCVGSIAGLGSFEDLFEYSYSLFM